MSRPFSPWPSPRWSSGTMGANTADPFSAEQALRYITFLTIGYMLARGLAKSGSRSHQDDDRA